ncbi:MAG: Gfo/Idh/MocA family protein [Candidatus Hodarchaeota archaeon]
MKKLNIGIVGAGAVAEVYHLPALTRMPEFNIAKIAENREERFKRISNLYNLKKTELCDFNSIITDPSIDAILILTPPKTHLSMIEAAVREKKGIFCEKPVVMNYKEAEKLDEIITNSGISFLPGFNFRFIPVYKRIKNLITRKKFGNLLSANFTLFANAYKWPSVSKFQYSSDQGGGALFEMGCHMIDLSTWYFGEPEYIRGKIYSIRKNSEIDDTASIFIEFKSGIKVIVNIAWNDMSINSIELTGTHGKGISSANGNDVLFYANKLIRQPPIRIKTEPIISPFHEELLYFHKMITKSEKSLIPIEEIKLTTKIIDTVYSQN